MDSRAAIIASCWFAIAIVSAMFIFVGGVNLGTGIAVALLILIAAGVTFGVGFGLKRCGSTDHYREPRRRYQASSQR